jgi:hypothetical protein
MAKEGTVGSNLETRKSKPRDDSLIPCFPDVTCRIGLSFLFCSANAQNEQGQTAVVRLLLPTAVWPWACLLPSVTSTYLPVWLPWPAVKS